MAESLTQKLARRKRITEEISQLNQELEQVDRDIFARVGKVIEAFEGPEPESAAQPEKRQLAVAHKSVTPSNLVITLTKKGASLREIEAATTEILRTVGKPLKLRFLLDELVKKGVSIGGQNPSANLSAHLSGSNVFETASDGWWFRGQARPTNKNAPEGASLI